MRAFKKVLILIIVLSIISSILTCYCKKTIKTISNTRRQIKAGVLLYSFYDELSLLIRKNLEDIQIENENKIQFSFFNGKSNLAVENEELNTMIQGDFDLIIASVIDTKEQDIISDFVYKTKQKNIPLILFNSNPSDLKPFKENSKAILIEGDIKQSGILQGEMIANLWNANKEALDKNGDNIMQYIMLQGKPDAAVTNIRTINSISTINNAKIKTQELASVSANWEQELAKSTIESLFFKYANKIEVIISNNDTMGIGAIQALQKYGYNKGDKSKFIPVFGIDGMPEAENLIKKGEMSGTVLADFRAFAETIYTVGMNLVYNLNPLEGTNYKFDKTGITILIPYKGYIVKDE